jgi:hypothetical protein
MFHQVTKCNFFTICFTEQAWTHEAVKLLSFPSTALLSLLIFFSQSFKIFYKLDFFFFFFGDSIGFERSLVLARLVFYYLGIPLALK